MGPTASGKTAVALELSEHLPVEIISVDSAMVYRGMDIGTAKPDQQTLNEYPHQLIDIIDPAEVYSAGQFREDALSLMQQITSDRRSPILVGGTMLYFNTLQKGIANMPEVDDSVKQSIEEEAKTRGILAMHDRLKSVDPVSAERIHPNDPQRIKRALELYDFTGKTLTDFWREQDQNQARFIFPYRRIKIALMPDDRVELRKRITSRFDIMLQQGFIEEVEGFYNRGDLHARMPSIRAVGYRHRRGHQQQPEGRHGGAEQGVDHRHVPRLQEVVHRLQAEEDEAEEEADDCGQGQPGPDEHPDQQ